MSKGQRRSNREVRKPKKEKAQAKVETAFGAQVKRTGSAYSPKGKQTK